MLTVVSQDWAEDALAAGTLPCPVCPGVLRGHGWARVRTIRTQGQDLVRLRPRRARCPQCTITQVLLPGGFLPRRADCIQVVGSALVARGRGEGTRKIAERLGRARSTVRGWLSGIDDDHLNWLFQTGAQIAARVDPGGTPAHHTPFTSLLVMALSALAQAAHAVQRRFHPQASLWALIGVFAQGKLLPPVVMCSEKSIAYP